MKKLLVPIIFLATTLGCSDPNLQESNNLGRNFSAEETAIIKRQADRFISIFNSYQLADTKKKELFANLIVGNFAHELRTLITDPEELDKFDDFIQKKEISDFLGWVVRLSTMRDFARTNNTYDAFQFLSARATQVASAIASAMASIAESYFYVSYSETVSQLSNYLQSEENNVYQDNQLTQTEKEAILIVIAQQYEAIPDLIISLGGSPWTGGGGAIPRVMGIGRIIGSIIVHAVIIGIVGAVIAVTLGAGAPVLVSLGLFTFEMINIGAVIGGIAGAVVGGALAAQNECWDFATFSYQPCN